MDEAAIEANVCARSGDLQRSPRPTRQGNSRTSSASGIASLFDVQLRPISRTRPL